MKTQIFLTDIERDLLRESLNFLQAELQGHGQNADKYARSFTHRRINEMRDRLRDQPASTNVQAIKGAAA